MPFQLLHAKKTISYKVPEAIARNPKNLFFGDEEYIHEIWHFLAFLEVNIEPMILRFTGINIEWDYLSFEGFNPIEEPGYLALKTNEFEDLISTLKKVYKLSFKVDFKEGKQTSFRLITKDKELKSLGIKKLDSPGEPEIYFFQISDPIEDINTNKITCLLFSWSRIRGIDDVIFQILHYSKEMLNEPSFKPRDFGLTMINLDKKGMRDFIEILSWIHGKILIETK